MWDDEMVCANRGRSSSGKDRPKIEKGKEAHIQTWVMGRDWAVFLTIHLFEMDLLGVRTEKEKDGETLEANLNA